MPENINAAPEEGASRSTKKIVINEPGQLTIDGEETKEDILKMFSYKRSRKSVHLVPNPSGIIPSKSASELQPRANRQSTSVSVDATSSPLSPRDSSPPKFGGEKSYVRGRRTTIAGGLTRSIASLKRGAGGRPSERKKISFSDAVEKIKIASIFSRGSIETAKSEISKDSQVQSELEPNLQPIGEEAENGNNAQHTSGLLKLQVSNAVDLQEEHKGGSTAEANNKTSITMEEDKEKQPRGDESLVSAPREDADQQTRRRLDPEVEDRGKIRPPREREQFDAPLDKEMEKRSPIAKRFSEEIEEVQGERLPERTSGAQAKAQKERRDLGQRRIKDILRRSTTVKTASTTMTDITNETDRTPKRSPPALRERITVFDPTGSTANLTTLAKRVRENATYHSSQAIFCIGRPQSGKSSAASQILWVLAMFSGSNRVLREQMRAVLEVLRPFICIPKAEPTDAGFGPTRAMQVIELLLDERSIFCGLHVDVSLLELNRVLVSSDQSNFACFREFCNQFSLPLFCSTPKTEPVKKGPRSKSETMGIPRETFKAMELFGIDHIEMERIAKCLSAISCLVELQKQVDYDPDDIALTTLAKLLDIESDSILEIFETMEWSWQTMNKDIPLGTTSYELLEMRKRTPESNGKKRQRESSMAAKNKTRIYILQTLATMMYEQTVSYLVSKINAICFKKKHAKRRKILIVDLCTASHDPLASPAHQRSSTEAMCFDFAMFWWFRAVHLIVPLGPELSPSYRPLLLGERPDDQGDPPPYVTASGAEAIYDDVLNAIRSRFRGVTRKTKMHQSEQSEDEGEEDGSSAMNNDPNLGGGGDEPKEKDFSSRVIIGDEQTFGWERSYTIGDTRRARAYSRGLGNLWVDFLKDQALVLEQGLHGSMNSISITAGRGGGLGGGGGGGGEPGGAGGGGPAAVAQPPVHARRTDGIHSLFYGTKEFETAPRREAVARFASVMRISSLLDAAIAKKGSANYVVSCDANGVRERGQRKESPEVHEWLAQIVAREVGNEGLTNTEEDGAYRSDEPVDRASGQLRVTTGTRRTHKRRTQKKQINMLHDKIMSRSKMSRTSLFPARTTYNTLRRPPPSSFTAKKENKITAVHVENKLGPGEPKKDEGAKLHSALSTWASLMRRLSNSDASGNIKQKEHFANQISAASEVLRAEVTKVRSDIRGTKEVRKHNIDKDKRATWLKRASSDVRSFKEKDRKGFLQDDYDLSSTKEKGFLQDDKKSMSSSKGPKSTTTPPRGGGEKREDTTSGALLQGRATTTTATTLEGGSDDKRILGTSMPAAAAQRKAFGQRKKSSATLDEAMHRPKMNARESMFSRSHTVHQLSAKSNAM